MELKKRENAHRLAGALERYAADPRTVQQLAMALNYHEGQLREDMAGLLGYILEIEEIALEAPRSP